MRQQEGTDALASAIDTHMNRFTLTLVVIVIALIATGVVFLATWDIPPPSEKVEKVLDDGRFPR